MTTAPMNPLAGVSGPGKFAVRTDRLDMGSTGYGEGVQTADIKSGAALSTSPDVRGQAPSTFRESLGQSSQTPVTGMYDPTSRPNEPVTNGVDMGSGAGSSALMMTKTSTKLSDTLVAMLPYDDTGEIAILYQEALARGD